MGGMEENPYQPPTMPSDMPESADGESAIAEGVQRIFSMLAIVFAAALFLGLCHGILVYYFFR
jgi:hypothetical protein